MKKLKRALIKIRLAYLAVKKRIKRSERRKGKNKMNRELFKKKLT